MMLIDYRLPQTSRGLLTLTGCCSPCNHIPVWGWLLLCARALMRHFIASFVGDARQQIAALGRFEEYFHPLKALQGREFTFHLRATIDNSRFKKAAVILSSTRETT